MRKKYKFLIPVIISLTTLLCQLSTIVNASENNIVINEILINPSGSSSEPTEFIELYNFSSKIVDISGWILDDIENGGSNPHVFPENLIIQPEEYFVIYRENSKIALNNSEDTVRLINSIGSIIDSYSYSNEPGEDISLGRFPDGVGEWVALSNLTPGSENVPPPSSTPTNTPSLTPTRKPTNTPKPSKTPKPTKTPKPSKIPTLTRMLSPTITTSNINGLESYSGSVQGFSDSKVKKEFDIFLPTASPSATTAENPIVATVAGTSRNKAGNIFFLLGGLSLAAAGISAYKIIRDDSQTNSNG